MMKKGLLGILVVILVLGVGQYGLAAQIELGTVVWPWWNSR